MTIEGILTNPENFPEDMTIGELRVYLKKNWKQGCTCACGNRVQLYNRPLTSAMSYALLYFKSAKKDEEGYAHAEDFFKKQDCSSSLRGDFPKLRFWGFIAPKPSLSDDDLHSPGFYKILPRGLEFLEGNLVVPASVLIYNNKFIGWGEKTTDLKGALKNKFNINDLKIKENV